MFKLGSDISYCYRGKYNWAVVRLCRIYKWKQVFHFIFNMLYRLEKLLITILTFYNLAFFLVLCIFVHISPLCSEFLGNNLSPKIICIHVDHLANYDHDSWNWLMSSDHVISFLITWPPLLSCDPPPPVVITWNPLLPVVSRQSYRLTQDAQDGLAMF